jgi:hypothetical protein
VRPMKDPGRGLGPAAGRAPPRSTCPSSRRPGNASGNGWGRRVGRSSGTRPLTSARPWPAFELGGMAGASIDDVPSSPAVPEPTRSHGRLGAVVGLAVLVVNEAVASAPLSATGPGVVHEADGSQGVGRASSVLVERPTKRQLLPLRLIWWHWWWRFHFDRVTASTYPLGLVVDEWVSRDGVALGPGDDPDLASGGHANSLLPHEGKPICVKGQVRPSAARFALRSRRSRSRWFGAWGRRR